MTIPFKIGDKVIDNLSNKQRVAIILSIDMIAERVMIKFKDCGYGSRKFHEVTKQS